MKRDVIITMTIDTDEYDDVKSAEDAIDLAQAMIDGWADFPDQITIACDGVTKNGPHAV